MRRTVITGGGSVMAAFLASLCCIGPFFFASLGVFAGLVSFLEPLRPVLGVLMIASLGVAFWTVYRPRMSPAAAPSADSAAGDSGNVATAMCTMHVRRSRDVTILWIATALALGLWTFPTWSRWLP